MDDEIDRRLRQAEELGEPDLRIEASRVRAADLAHLRIRRLVVAGALTERLTLAVGHVPRVVGDRPRAQVLEGAAGGFVAGVANHRALRRDVAALNLEGDSVRVRGPPVEVEAAISSPT